MHQITFFLPGCVVPKARPRVTRNGTFMPARYQDWRKNAEKEILIQIKKQGLESVLPLERMTVEILLTGKHRLSGDADNILGSYLDAFVSAGVLKNDNLSCIPEVHLKLNSDGELGAVVNIYLLPTVSKEKRTRQLKRKLKI